MNILHIISGNDNGGGGNHVINICKNKLEDMNCFLLCMGNGELYNKALKNNIIAFNYSFGQIVRGTLKSIIKSKNIDIVDFHGAKSNFLYLLVNRNIKIPCVVTIHSDYRYDFLNSWWKKYLYTFLSTMGLKKFKNYICVSSYLKNILQHNNFKGNKYVVKNGIEFKLSHNLIQVEKLRSQFNIGKHDFVYIMVARMHPIKNHENLIKAFYILQKEFNNVKLILVGNGPLETKLKDFVCRLGIENKIIFTGFRENTYDFVNSSDISVLISLNEGGAPPLVILESALLKKTVICSNVGDMNSVINNSKNGYLVNPRDEYDIFVNMKKAYLNKNNLYNMGQNLYRDMSDKFSLEKFWNDYYNAYLHILNGVK